MIKTHITDGRGFGYQARVQSNNSIPVCVVPNPVDSQTLAESEQLKCLVGSLQTSAASSDMTIDGSSTAVDFYVQGAGDRIKTITQLRTLLHANAIKITGVEARGFGTQHTAPGLTNGLKLFATQGGVEHDLFVSNIVVIGDFYTYADVNGITYDEGAVAANVDLLMMTMTLQAPIKLHMGSDDRLTMRIQDDLSHANYALFETYYFGYQEIA